ncbi:hypothetical protein [Costertonia aggregata]|uniref:Uncharacterized protein n=1 Tax=Costertonia aggregata TaxID=343403 RepID=A0A7H9APC0_9FLAO|nr:hypothetical protein [Costertonia aggregata]QLG45254.1 hypothetical protein HYG79_07805 [Costertonia aggregata]
MADKQPQNNSDEIDLGQLFQMIGKGLNKIFIGFLRVFLYLKKRIFILLGLLIIGAALGYGLNQIRTKRLKTEVIVKPNMESKNYLYDVVNEIQANLKAKNIDFFKSIGVNLENLEGLEIEIGRVEGSKSSESDLKYLELLQSFEKTDAISDIVRAELENKSSFNHRITFFYKDADKGQRFAEKIIEYINTNDYFDGLVKTFRSNAENRIEENKTLLKQVDELVANYSKKMAQEDRLTGSERIVLDNQEQMDITGLFNLKNSLIRDIELKKMDLQENTDAIKVINFGKPQQVQKSFFGKSLVLIPLVLLGIFFVFSFLKYLNKKAAEIQ